MLWTNQKPTRQGWYWFKEASDCSPVAVEVRVWRLDTHLRESLYMFYRPNDPEETGVYLLDDISAGEWLGPIGPSDPHARPLVVEKIVEKPAEQIVVEKIVEVPAEPVIIEKIVEKVVPSEPVIVEKIVEKIVPAGPAVSAISSEVPLNGDPADARAIIDWFISIGTDHFPTDMQAEHVVKLANMLSYSLKLGRKFEVATDVVRFLVENGDEH
jgi:hypothetical protein